MIRILKHSIKKQEHMSVNVCASVLRSRVKCKIIYGMSKDYIKTFGIV